MKFKYLVIAFAAVIIIIILFTALLPITLERPESTENFRQIMLPLLVAMALVLISMIVFFLINYRLLSLLEREDWPALSYYLEQKVLVKGKYSARNVRLLASSYLVVSDFPSVSKLEEKAMLAKPSVIEKNVLLFGAAKILTGKYTEAAEFFKTYTDKVKASERQWARWFYGFSQLLCSSFTSAEPEFTSLALFSNDALITGLSAFFLQNSIAKYSLKPEECRVIAENGRARVKRTFPSIKKWNKEVEKVGMEIYIAIVRKYIDTTGKWLYERQPTLKSENEFGVMVMEEQKL